MVCFKYSINKPVQNFKNCFKILWMNFTQSNPFCITYSGENSMLAWKRYVNAVGDKYQLSLEPSLTDGNDPPDWKSHSGYFSSLLHCCQTELQNNPENLHCLCFARTTLKFAASLNEMLKFSICLNSMTMTPQTKISLWPDMRFVKA